MSALTDALFAKGYSDVWETPGKSSSGTVDAATPLDVSRLGLGLGNGTQSNTYQDPLDNIISSIFGFQKDEGRVGDEPIGQTLGTAALGTATEEQPLGTGGGLFDIGSWLPRVAIIVLGFIFVAAGLSMFRPATVIQQALR